MLTWLDYYVQGASKSLRAAGLDDYGGDDVAAMAVLSSAKMAYLAATGDRHRIDSDDAVSATLATCVHAFTAHAITKDDLAQIQAVYKATGGKPEFARKLYTTRAIRPASDLLETLRGARAPDTDDWRKPLLEATWYFDIPNRALIVGPSLQLRAVFTQPTRLGTIAVVCVLTPPGSNKSAGRFAWLWGDAVYGLRIPGVDPEIVRDRLEHLLRLLVLYAQTAEKAEFAPVHRIRSAEMSGLKPKKRKARLNNASMFTIRKLKPPKDCFGRRTSGSQEKSKEPAWRLDRAVEVRGHFKWQPHGPKRSKRRLIWIDPYVRGPKDQAPKPVLEILPEDTHGA